MYVCIILKEFGEQNHFSIPKIRSISGYFLLYSLLSFH